MMTGMFVKYFCIFSPAIASLQDRIAVDRFIYEKPHCESVNACRGRNGCDGSILYNRVGQINLANYTNYFNCRWEIRGGLNSKIRVKVESAGNFGIENHRFCGFDRLNLQNFEGTKKFGRICSSPRGETIPYNGMDAVEYGTSANSVATKIKSSAFRNGVTLDSSELVVAFDADNQNTGAGFVLHYEIIGDIDDLVEGELTDIGDNLEAGLLHLTKNIASNQRREAVSNRIRKLFALYSKKMSQCRNGDLSSLLLNFSAAGFEEENLTKVHDEWYQIFEASFEKCDLPIMKKHGSFSQTSWPRRIESVIRSMEKHFSQ
ncbi:Oidioi.mRNA.OKI2018_I69.chr2.g7480.t1.cds [Oikopleura dioica]|uniref:Oidioi.mRNA.OKI2018_I69.chr2.g7480.t1.cds n=1 Tax=Oikopleura dioica TaxID=34765 RepID=A0ABN7T6Y6_OIKDI|nr:Oidioi.mRNA.OKI2018_I69.chr2.g7480.t1.cds [Oikopleura dioica]